MNDAALIALVRQLIGDPAGESQTFEDDMVMASLDEHRIDAVQALLVGTYVRAATGGGGYGLFAHPSGLRNWAEGELLQDASLATVTADVDDLPAGLWRFTVPRHSPTLYLTGSSFDPWAAAADLLEQGAALAMDAYDFSADGQSFKRSQKVSNRATLIALYRSKARLETASLVRADVGSGGPGGAQHPALWYAPWANPPV